MKNFSRTSTMVLGVALAAGVGCSLVIADYPDNKLPQAGATDTGVTGVDVSPTDTTPATDTFVAWTALPCSSAVPPPVPPTGSLGPLIRYPSDQTLSLITPYVTSNILAIAKKHPGRASNSFIKVGDSITVNSNFLTCFTAKPPYATMSEADYVNLDKFAPLQKTINYFASCFASTTPFERVSLSAAGGTGSAYPLTGGDPSYLDQEATLFNPQFAVVMYGTNDIGDTEKVGPSGTPGTYGSHFGGQGYPGTLLTLVDALIARGIVPLMTTIPPKTTSNEAKLFVPTFNAVVRGIAEARQVPLIDWNRELLKVTPDYGLGADGTHPVYLDAQSCNLKPDLLVKYGFNIRNLITLQTLERVRQVFVEKVANIDIAPTGSRTIVLTGAGTAASPWDVDALPFTDVRDFLAAAAGTLSDYSSCAGTPALPGNEQIYKLVLTAKTPIRAFVSQKNSAIPLHLSMMSSAASTSCVVSDKAYISKTLDAGTYYFSVDAETTTETTNGEYMFGVVKCEDGDTSCT